MTIYVRKADSIELELHTIEQQVGPLTLTGYAIEPVMIQPDQPLRIQLDWSKPAVPQARVSLSLIGPNDQVVATDRRTYDASAWPAIGGSVYHTLIVGSDAPPGRYRAYIDVKSDAGSGQTSIGAWKSPLGEVELPSDLIAQPARFGNAIDLLGYTLESDNAIRLTLYWQSYQTVDRDYTVFVHLENERGELVLAADTQPHQGDYPTSIWSTGERVDDLHVIQLQDDLPAGIYQVNAGWYLLESGQRLMLEDGSDQITLTTITIDGR